MVTYINEPFPNAKNKPHRNLTRPELMEFFKAADIVVKLSNPDIMKSVEDGMMLIFLDLKPGEYGYRFLNIRQAIGTKDHDILYTTIF